MSWSRISSTIDSLINFIVDIERWALWLKKLRWPALVAAALMVIVHLVVRFAIWPDMAHQKEQLAAYLSQTTNTTVQIGELKTEWSFLWPSFTANQIEVTATNRPTTKLITIDQIQGEIDWSTLWHLSPQFHHLKIKQAKFDIRRDQNGQWFIAEIPLKTSGTDYKVLNWLLNQNKITLEKTKIDWLDQQKLTSKKEFLIDEFNIENGFFKHDIHAKLTSSLHRGVASFDADFKHLLFHERGNWSNWSGKFNWDVSELNLRELNTWVENSVQFHSGTINTTGELFLNNGLADGAQAKITGNNLHLEWPKIAKPLKIHSITSEIEQTLSGSQMALNAPVLKWKISDQAKEEELNNLGIYWRIAPNIQSIKYAGIQAKHIDLALLEQLIQQFPLPHDIREVVDNYQPSGEVENLDANWNADPQKLPFDIKLPWLSNSRYNLSFDFTKLTLKPEKAGIPSLSNWTGRLKVTESTGVIDLRSEKSSLTLPKTLETEQFGFDEVTGQIKWAVENSVWSYSFDQLRINNQDFEVVANGKYHPHTAKSAEHLKLNGLIERAQIQNISRYLPLGMSNYARNYIRGALLSGEIIQGKVEIDGNPQDIPFGKNRQGVFNLTLPIRNARYLPAPGSQKKTSANGIWSEFSKLHGVVNFKGPQLQVDLDQANYASIQLRKIKASTDNISSLESVIHIQGLADGLAQDFVQYFSLSPSGQRLTSHWEKIRIDGLAQLAMKLDIPISDANNTKVEGSINFKNNQANIGKQIELKDIQGEVFFSEEKILGKNLTAQFMGGSILVDTSTQLPWQKQAEMRVKGTAQFHELMDVILDKNNSATDKILSQLNGPIQYEGKASLSPKGYKVSLQLDLNKFASNLPAPLNKKVNEALKGEALLESQSINSKTEHLGTVRLGKLIETKYALFLDQKTRLGIGINSPANIPTQGSNLNIVSDQLDIGVWQDWSDKYVSDQPGNKGEGLPIDTVSFYVAKLRALGREFKDVAIVATHDKDLWQASINSSFAIGLVQWRSSTPSLPQGKLTAKLQELNIESKSSDDNIAQRINERIQKIPALDVQSEQLVINGKKYGQLALLASNDKNDWKIEKLNLKTGDGSLSATGRWIVAKTNNPQINSGRTELNFDLDIDNAGNMLRNFGLSSTIEDGSGKLVGNLNWVGEPHKFDIKTLKGDLSLDLIKGTVLQVDPGAARLLGVLSFQGLNRIATLDIGGVLKPIVTKGTPFDRITAKGNLATGTANISDLTMKGPQGNVRLTGKADLLRETQDVRITVTPNVNAGSASLAYTFINPIIGLSTLVGQYLIADEVSKLFQLDYLVQGTWANPQVIALDSKGRPLDEKQLMEIRDKSLLKQQGPNKK